MLTWASSGFNMRYLDPAHARGILGLGVCSAWAGFNLRRALRRGTGTILPLPMQNAKIKTRKTTDLSLALYGFETYKGMVRSDMSKPAMIFFSLQEYTQQNPLPNSSC
jgi:hypothetical protein